MLSNKRISSKHTWVNPSLNVSREKKRLNNKNNDPAWGFFKENNFLKWIPHGNRDVNTTVFA